MRIRDEVAQGALRWLRASTRRLRRARRIEDVKRLTEIAIVADLLHRRREAGEPLVPLDETRRLLRGCWTALSRGEAIRALVVRDGAWGFLATSYVPFFRHGLRSATLERTLREVLSTTEYRPLHFARWVAAAQRALGGAIGHPPRAVSRWPARWLGRRPTVADVYVLTHDVFLGTDFGRRPPGHPMRHALRRRLPDLLERCARKGLLDLVAELAIVAHCLGDCVPATVWQSLWSAQRQDGTVPFSRRSHSIHRDYHSTLVTLAACAVCLHAVPRRSRT
jgi:hypothetical protein